MISFHVECIDNFEKLINHIFLKKYFQLKQANPLFIYFITKNTSISITKKKSTSLINSHCVIVVFNTEEREREREM